MPQTQQRLLKVNEVAALLGVSQEHVRRLNDRGAMPRAMKLGRSIRWDRSAVEQWVVDRCPDLSTQRRRA